MPQAWNDDTGQVQGVREPSWGGGNGQAASPWGGDQPGQSMNPMPQQALPPNPQQSGAAAPSWGLQPGAGQMSIPLGVSGQFQGGAPGGAGPVGNLTGSWPGQMPTMNTPGAPSHVDPNGPKIAQPPPYAGYGIGPAGYGTISSDPLHPNPSNIAGMAPANIQQFGGTPQVNPTYANAAQQNYLTGNAAQQGYMQGNATSINPASAQQYLNQAESTTMQALNPLFQQQNAQLAQSLAARGISNSGSAQQLQNDLMSQQAGQYAQAISPMISQGFGYAQQDVTGNAAAQNQFGLANLGYGNAALGANAGYQQQMNLANLGYGNAALGTNAGYQQQANMANAQASNEANILNANYYATDRNANATAYNNYMNELLGLGSGQLNAIESAYLNSFGPSTGVESAYGNALSGQQSIYGSVFGNAMNAQQQQMQMAAMMAAGG